MILEELVLSLIFNEFLEVGKPPTAPEILRPLVLSKTFCNVKFEHSVRNPKPAMK